MMSQTRLSLILLAGTLAWPACAKNPTQPPPWRLLNSPMIDADPVWSRDGQSIAFHRRGFSSAGPPGVYVVASAGGPIRYVAPGDFFWPKYLRFSPDDRRLVAVYGLQLYIIDIPTATFWNLFYREDLATHPDWSPDGRYIVYTSRGIHRYDLETGQEELFPYGAKYPLWSRDGKQIAFIQTRVDGDNIALINPDGTGYRLLAASPPHSIIDILHWYLRPARGMEGLAYGQSSPGAGYYFVSRDGSHRQRFEYRYGPHEAFSPDGEWVVRPGIDPVDSVGVLFVQRIDDVTGASRRQLTHWDPPDSLPRATAGAAASRLPHLAHRSNE